MMRFRFWFCLLFGLLAPAALFAEDASPTEATQESTQDAPKETKTEKEAAPADAAATETPPAETRKSQKKQSKGKRVREREQEEGTQAPDRFEANTVIKSKYQFNGEPLEVDPD